MKKVKLDYHIDLILPEIKAEHIDKIFKTLSVEASDYLNLSSSFIFQELKEKEKFSNSDVGNGVFIPQLRHSRVNTPFIALTTLQKPLLHETVDRQPIDIACLLLSPTSEPLPYHLQRLAFVSRLLSNNGMRSRILEKKGDAEAIRSALKDPNGWMLAAA